MLPDAAVQAFLTAVRFEDPDRAFAAFAELVRAALGTRLLTASVFEIEGEKVTEGRSRRIYTDNAEAYPVGGFKPIPDNAWTDIVLRRQEVFSTLSIEEIAEVFFDWELIRSLGCESNVNVPVVVGGQVIGTINLLDAAGSYTAERLAPLPALMPYAIIAFLLVTRPV
ncbi:hypothetical protein BJF93_22905 [Xaviernesmea oryzae]|uniref:GAF domain-containing protein n=1 Tax=Xaviernesmea oryzae TaxID=464029 RepID=A0A1Q9ATX9_9HYPH|nr:GAF domain-containing protein [Xaviernesmea oryzae]OLP58885.1 hypothetical protein BJF93_22905 [Xaviernesmea oryzae]SEM02938.1 hypothetical protein SAMN04487976_11787 [Xaviernesmea oryzae]